MEIKHCKRCDEDWCYRGTGRPLRCGKCKSPYWDRPRRTEERENTATQQNKPIAQLI